MSFNLLIEVLGIGLVLCADSFSAALALGFRSHTKKDVLKFALSSGGAEALATIVGALAGVTIISRFDFIDHWIAFFLLIGVALHMIYEGIKEIRSQDGGFSHKLPFHSFFKILLVSLATSLDALAVGVSLGVSNKPLSPFVISIGAWAFLATVIGMAIAKKVSQKLGPIFSLSGSVILIVLGFRLLEL